MSSGMGPSGSVEVNNVEFQKIVLSPSYLMSSLWEIREVLEFPETTYRTISLLMENTENKTFGKYF